MTTSTGPQANGAAWEQTAADLAGRAETDETALNLLAEVCLAGCRLMPEHALGGRPGGLPPGRPAPAVLTGAAQVLLRAARARPGRQARYQEAVALLSIEGRWDVSAADPGLGLRAHAERCEQATAIARELADDVLLAMCLYYLGKAERRLTRWQRALTRLEEATATAVRLLAHPGTHRGAFGAAGDTPPPWAEPMDVQQRMIACRSLKETGSVAAVLGDLDRWKASTRRMVELAEPLVEARPTMPAEALSKAAGLARHLGDRDEFRRIERRLRLWAEESGSNRATRGWLAVAADNAAHLHDYGRAYELHLPRMRACGEGLNVTPPPGAAPHAYLPLADALEDRGMRARQIALGNAAYDAALALWRSRRTAQSEEAREEAGQWLDVAAKAWEKEGHNGLLVIRLTRARLLVDAAAFDPEQVTGIALDVSKEGLIAGSRANAAGMAALWCRPGDERVRERLNELIDAATPHQRGSGLLYRARWYRRLAEHLEHVDAPADETARAWRRAEQDALAAAQALEVNGVLVNAKLIVEAWTIAAASCGRTGQAAADLTEAERLHRMLQVIRGVTELLITSSHAEDRIRLVKEHGRIFSAAAELAVGRGDTLAADLIMEAVRRDRVGLLLSELTIRDDVAEAIRSAAERIIAANNAAPTLPRPSEDGQVSNEQRDRTLGNIADRIHDNRIESIRQADHILGVLSSMADGHGLSHVTAAEVLALHRPGTEAAILQLCPEGTGLLADGPRSRRLYRRLTWRHPDGRISEHLDAVTTVDNLTRMQTGDVRYWPQLSRLTTHLLPEALLHRLREGTQPLRLLLVPSGLFDLAFDALPVDDNRYLIDVAVLSVHTSLTTMAHLLRKSPPSGRQGTVAIYDTTALSHAQAELASLRTHLQPVYTLQERREVFDRLREGQPAYRILAMAVHGYDDKDGWGQIKQLPDRSVFTAAQAMALSYPALCVLASCHSNIRLRDNLELAGFPLALFARGATTVLGSLFAIDDRATSEIMQLYWRRLAEGVDPVRALRDARLQWLAEDPDRRPALRLWAGMTVLGGAHV
ncbi:CHAT domain-containing protein [Streptomyces sp. NPDC014864]|uniref:CHAT domain-containing protein n=1 Tax=Streptomyces sp. NPDC014864 TaxID=3364924 RepID=UPI0036F6EC00